MKLAAAAVMVLLVLAVACGSSAQVPTAAPEGSPERIFQEAVGPEEVSADQRDLELLAIEVRLMWGRIAKETDRITALEQAITELQQQVGMKGLIYGSVQGSRGLQIRYAS